jgi:hypothetical protein
MKNLFIIKKTIIAIAFIFTTSVVPTFAQWDSGSTGNYTGGWDSGSTGNYTGGWDSGSTGNYTGGWDSGSTGNYTGGWDSGSTGNYTGGWDSGSTGNYTGGWDSGSTGNYTGGWDSGSTGNYTGGWDTGSTVSYTAVPYTVQDYSSYPTTYTTGATSYTVPNFNSYPTTYGGTGSYIAPTFTTYPTNNSTICSDGSTPINGSCNRVTTIPTTSNTICSDGSAPVNGSCTRTNTIPVTTNTVCSDGFAPTNGSCVRTTTIPTNTNIICSDGSTPINGSCTRTTVIPTNNYQTCWDGSTLPFNSSCPPQFKYCANGTSVLVTQGCFTPTTPVFVPQQTVRFNNVVTSVATEISKTSGRCNGIGLIASGAPSTGWFEYGETSNLGRTTATANIGSANTAPFSNVLANLKPTTRYYCRAVMQNQYGLVKGEIVSFTTKSTVVSYVKPVTKPAVTHTTVKKPVVNTITCSDGSTVKTKSTSSATLINQGDKLIAVQVEKLDGNLISGEVVRYKITYKNLADTRLSGVLIKVTLPQEIVLAGATAGNYDLGTRTLTLNQDTVDPYTEGIIMITANVQKDAPIGKTIVTNVYAAYTVPGTAIQDEVTAYVVGSIMPNQAITNQDTGAKKVIGQSSAQGFMPNTLIEWLALLAIMFIIFILGRSVYASYKDDEGSKHH